MAIGITGRFPRTTREFADNGRIVVMRCPGGHTTWIRPEQLVQRLGADFDLYDGFAELQDTFPCDCGEARQEVSFVDTTRQSFAAVSFEEATTYALEARAFARARDEARLPPDQRGKTRTSVGKYRKFGPWRR